MSVLFDAVPEPGYHPVIATLLAALQDGTREGRDELGEVEDAAIVWQPFPNGHSIGTLLLHNAECEASWFEEMSMGRTLSSEQRERWMSQETMVEDCIWPTPPKQPLGYYYAVCDEVRAKSIETLKEFADPARIVTSKSGHSFSLRWIVGHVVQHESYHLGQAVLLKAIWQKSR